MICRPHKKRTSNRKYPGAKIRVFPVITGKIYQSIGSRWLDIGQVPFCKRLWTEGRKSINTQKKNKASIQSF